MTIRNAVTAAAWVHTNPSTVRTQDPSKVLVQLILVRTMYTAYEAIQL